MTTTFSVWDVTSVEWLLMVVLAFGFFNVVVPLYQNQRMTAYYWRQFKKNKAAVASLVFLIVTFVIGFVGPVFLPPPELSLTEQYLPPMGVTAQPPGYAEPISGTLAHPLGTDHQGQDMLKLVIFGMRVSMQVGLLSMSIAVGIGTLVGTTAAHAGGIVDEVLMRYVDIQSTFPVFLLLLLLIYLYGGSLILIIALYGFFGWEGIARQVRSEALQKNEEAYIQASEAAGASQWWIVRRHIIPNTSSTIITAATLAIPAFILGEATLSFLGFADPEIYSWGQVIAGGRGDLRGAPWISTVPGFFLFFMVLAFNYLGDALRDSIDPRQEQE
ncbi:ABC transporter permease [Halobacteriales archaeon QS_8_69_26]|nr:MAG: ABC transporter permease [Halobacteriales archaeon QS_8_69_26]